MEFLHLLGHAFEHAFKDTLPLLPWLILIYIVIELLETKTDFLKNGKLQGPLAPVVGSATGLIPQCGFSVLAAKLYEQKYITVGTLLAIFMATSDEAFIVLLSSGEGAVWVLPMLAVKVIIGMAVGYAADLLLKWIGKGQVCVQPIQEYQESPKNAHEYFIKNYLLEDDVEVGCARGRTHEENNPLKNYLFSPLLHALKIALYIFLVNFVLSAIIEGVGEPAFIDFMRESALLQPLLTSAIGLIPNCASSVLLTQTFLSEGITFGSCVAGLCANAGMGFVVLLKNVKKWKRNLLLIVITYAVSVLVGLLFNVRHLSLKHRKCWYI